MRVKIGENWYEATPDQPIMIELWTADRTNIGNMVPGASRYAVFHEDDQSSADDRIKWMDAGARSVGSP